MLDDRGFLGKERHISAALPPILRTLLVTDGTVTKTLGAYFWEPIQVDTLEQKFVTAKQPIPWLNVIQGASILVRTARLSGVDSGKVFANAFSVIRTELIQDQFLSQLLGRKIGIGELIRDSGMESYREILEISNAQTADGNINIIRTYRLFIDKEPVILITESFPLSTYTGDQI